MVPRAAKSHKITLNRHGLRNLHKLEDTSDVTAGTSGVCTLEGDMRQAMKTGTSVTDLVKSLNEENFDLESLKSYQLFVARTLSPSRVRTPLI